MSKTKSNLQIIHIAITIALMFVGRFLPPVGTITPLGMEILGIFLGLIYGWTFCNMIWPSFLGLVLIGLSDYSSVNGILAAGMGQSTVMFVFFLYIFCGLINQSGLAEYIGKYIVSLKFAQGKPYLLAFLLCFAAWLMAGLISMVAASVLLWQILYEVCEQLGYKKGDKYRTLMVIGIFYSAAIGNMILPFKIYPMIVLGAFEAASGMAVNFLQYTIFMVIMTMILEVLFILLCKFVFRPQVSTGAAQLEPPAPMNSFQKKVVIIMVAMIVAFLLPCILPAAWGITQLLNALGNNGIMIATLVACMLVQDGGKPLLTVKDAIPAGMNWDVYFLLMTAFPLASAMGSEATGITGFLVSSLSGVFGGHSAFVFCLLAVVIGGIMANVISNVVTPMILIPLLLPFAAEVGVNPAALTCMLGIVFSDSILLPSGAPVASLLLANDNVQKADIYKYGITLLLITMGMLSTVGQVLGGIIF